MISQENTRKLETILENVGGGVSTFSVQENGALQIIYQNEKLYQLFGYSRDQAKAENPELITRILSGDRDKVTEKISNLLQDRQPVQTDLQILKQNGSRAILRANLSVISMEGYGDVILSLLNEATDCI